MTGVAVVLFDGNGSGFADDMSLRRQMLGEGIPVLGVEHAVRQVPELVVEPPEGCSITTADHPGHSSPYATIQRLDNPDFVFFEPMKCHISSNSISLMSPATAGSGSFAISSTIHRYISEGECPKIFPSMLNEALPREYKITASAFLTTSDAFTRSSPSTKLRPHCLHL